MFELFTQASLGQRQSVALPLRVGDDASVAPLCALEIISSCAKARALADMWASMLAAAKPSSEQGSSEGISVANAGRLETSSERLGDSEDELSGTLSTAKGESVVSLS